MHVGKDTKRDHLGFGSSLRRLSLLGQRRVVAGMDGVYVVVADALQ